MTDKTHYIVLAHETASQSWARDASTLALFLGLVGFGVLLESAPLQWAGFIVAFLVILAKAGTLAKRMTIAEAREFLDHLEQGDDA